jgi:hypothetical protein
MENQTGVILNYYKMLSAPDADKSKVIKSFLSYVMERTPSQKDWMMLAKLVRDFDYDLVFDALVATRYRDIDFSSNFWGYVISVCKGMMKDTLEDNSDIILKRDTEQFLNKLKKQIGG